MMNLNRVAVWLGLFLSLLANRSSAETVFVEAESMQVSSNGWLATSNDQTRRASRVKTMWGADGAGDAVATKQRGGIGSGCATCRLPRGADRFRWWLLRMASRSRRKCSI
jgi:hypothetical protein